jgi:Ca2+-binding EF-hand superfamily protein
MPAPHQNTPSNASLLSNQEAADQCFKQADRSNSGYITPGELLLQLQESSSPDPLGTLPALFLMLDSDGDERITRADMRAGYARLARPAGLRVKVSGGVTQQEEGEMAALEEQAQGALQPKVAALRSIFQLLDRNSSGLVTARKCAHMHGCAYTVTPSRPPTTTHALGLTSACTISPARPAVVDQHSCRT